jgi:transposase InsO family protein
VDDLRRKNLKVGRDALFDLLRSQNMLVKPKKNYTKTTNSKHWLKKYPNLYASAIINEPEQVMVSDITYIKTHEKTHYLSLVTDAYSRKIIGYHLSDDLSAESVVKALRMAVKNKRSIKPSIHHSDRGLQYCSETYQKELRKHNIKPSMTDGYDCYQNALAERINGILKNEFLYVKCRTKAELKKQINESIEIYNNERPHMSLQLKTPNFIHEKTVRKESHGLNFKS